jgi:hypothetical protein
VAPRQGVDALNVVEVIRTRLLARAIPTTPHPLRLQPRKEALLRGVVTHVAFATHAAGDALISQQGLEVLARVLAALIGVVQQFLRLVAPPRRHLEPDSRIKRQRRYSPILAAFDTGL